MTPVWWNLLFAFSAVFGIIGGLLWAGWMIYGRLVTGPTGRRKAGSGRK